MQKTPKISQDVHVEPFWKRCDMCNLNYNIIGKMETFTKDSNYILENTGMNASKINVEEKVDLNFKLGIQIAAYILTYICSTLFIIE